MLNETTLKFSSLTTLVVAGALLAVACTADVTGNTPGSGPNGNTGGSGATAGGAGAVAGSSDLGNPPKVPGAPAVESAGPLPLLRLTHREYSNTMAELLGDTTKPGATFEPDSPGASGYQAPGTVATETARGYMAAAETLAATAITSKKLAIPCTAPADAAGETTCVTTLVKDFGAKAYRRALVQGEIDDLVKLFQKAKTLGFNFQDAVTHTVEAMLQSPNLLYHWEIGNTPPTRDPENAALVALTPDQLASRLAYFLWESPPDAALQMAAQSGQLATADGLKAQAARLLADDNRARRALFNFHRQWLHIDNLEDLNPGTDLGLQLGQELEAFVASVFVAGDGSLKSLLTAPYTFANASTAPEYGLTANGSGFTQVQLDPTQRLGVLMQVPFLRTNGIAPPVRRGLVVYKQLLCGDVPAPPGNIPKPEMDGPSTTTRERFAKHAEQACAKGCHALFDPWGFAFENFDSLGHYRIQENGKTVDASGELQAGGVIGGTTPKQTVVSFKNGLELVNALAASDEVSWCTSRHWSRYMLGRPEGDADVGALTNAYVAAAYQSDRATTRPFSVKDFLVSIVGTKAFRFRTPAAGEAL
ncbi:MAG TPA: DUF1592 domain-containing protein [Polyangiaceae bacterium]|jgi:hypothetical protein|nr:DUF1592 domain-containing protein [Polyangiaceae bacterium]